MESLISFVLDGRIVTVDLAASPRVTPTTTVLQFLRDLHDHKGAKEGCAEGDCGSCTVVLAEPDSTGRLQYRAVDSCLLFLPMIHGKQLITIENLRSPNSELHPVQQAMVDLHGIQCGFCTPGIVMSLFALYKKGTAVDRNAAETALSGNLCRCTGYRPIIDAALHACANGSPDHFDASEEDTLRLLSSIYRGTLFLQTDRQIYVRPVTFEEAKTFRTQYPDAVVTNGSTDVALRVSKQHEHLPRIIDISGVRELTSVEQRADTLRIGAGVSIADVAAFAEKDFPALHEMLRWYGSHQIRTLGTIGGSLGTASPIGDVLPVLIAYDAVIVLENLKGRREVPAHEYVIGYRRTVRTPDELIREVILPRRHSQAIIRSYKISKRKAVDISTVCAGFRLEKSSDGVVKRILLVYGGMADRTARAERTERFLVGKPWTRIIVEDAMLRLSEDFTPISDARATARGRMTMAKNLLLKFYLDSTSNT